MWTKSKQKQKNHNVWTNENINKDTESLKRNSEAEKNNNNNKKSLEGFKGRLEQAGETISELEDRTVEVIEAEEQTKTRLKKSEQSLRDPWDTI